MANELGEMLIAAGVVDADKVRAALVWARERRKTLAEGLIELGHADEASVYRGLAKIEGLPFVDLSKGNVSEQVLQMVPADLAVEQRIVPVIEKGGALVVAVDDPSKRIVADQLQFQLGRDVRCALTTPKALSSALAKYYGDSDAAVGATADALEASLVAGADGDDAPVIRLVGRMFADALKLRASDIHLEPEQAGLRVRYRIDGVLREIAMHPQHLAAPLVSRLKVMGSMDIAEKRKPQDGRIEVKLGTTQLDVRCSILPSNHGETIVMRLLDRNANLLSLADLGFDGEDQKWFDRLISRPNGIVLVTGPTGSGKTTSLYAALRALNRPDVKIITAEDPVEYHISGINQVQVNKKVGLTFARILRAMLRAAPNVILVGEIRDLETAEVAVQAALTGHLVFSTLHTNDAASAITRLIDMGIQPFLASAAVQGVMAQRLVRRLCPECRKPYEAEPEELRALGLEPSAHVGTTFYRPGGCTTCEGVGYKGRVGLFELLELDPALREIIFEGNSLDLLRRTAENSGRLRSLLTDGARKVMAGTTSVSEVLRVTRAAGALEVVEAD
ncbi:Type II/IV secretion system protein [Planctomycetes bacterium Pla163]|uniref:Type II/IV secretion system protein n=1 Tax=Rohdeia mirabilis TaxID=2528008 RepID=A0A518D1P4_9BACT|nr:Type II/IV secretion system protein [Planctomycetes bacterium Pla163]